MFWLGLARALDSSATRIYLQYILMRENIYFTLNYSPLKAGHMHGVPVPPEIVESILARLPIKPLLRFRSVSKLWNKIICHPYFSNLHSPSFPTRFLIRGNPTVTDTSSTSFCLLNFLGEEFQLDADLVDLVAPLGAADILCYCNGLLLLNDEDEEHVLWNPYTRIYWRFCVICGIDCQHKEVHKKVASILKRVALGICHDPTTDDYKVVAIDTLPPSFSVFSCKHRVWTKANEKIKYYSGISRRGGGVYVDGACYWICCYSPLCHRRASLLCFNGIEDKCEILKLPASVETGLGDLGETISYDMVLLNMKGCLGLIYRGTLQNQRIYIASMEKNGDENSWRNQTTIELDSCVVTFLTKRPPCPINNRLVVVFLNLSEFIVYDVYEESMVQGLQKFPKRWEGMLVPYHQRLFISMFSCYSE